MKVALVAAYDDGTGIANAAVNTALAMKRAGIEVVLQNFELAPQRVPLHPEILELEKNKSDLNNVDVILNISLPSLFSYRSGPLNVGYYFTETSEFIGSNWPNYLQLMDRLFVCCEQNLQSARNSNITIPIDIVPIACDIDRIRAPSPSSINLNTGTKFVFGAVADYSERKGVRNIIKAYLQEFTSADNVVLVLKTYLDNTSSQDSLNKINADINDIKKNIRKGTDNNVFPPIILITSYLTNEQILSLEQQFNCYLNNECGQANSLPTFESCILGKPVIVPNFGGQLDYIKKYPNAHIVGGHMESVYGMAETSHPVYLGSEKWFRPNMEEFKLAMRKVYTERKLLTNDNSLEEYRLEKVGQHIKNILEKALNEKV